MGLLDVFSGKVSYLNQNFYSNLNPLWKKIEDLKTPLSPFLLDCLALSNMIIESILSLKDDNFKKFISIKDYKLISKNDFSNALVIIFTTYLYQFTIINPFLKNEIYKNLLKVSSNTELSKNLFDELSPIKKLDLLRIDSIVWKKLISVLKIDEGVGPSALAYFSGYKNILFTEILKKFKKTVESAND